MGNWQNNWIDYYQVLEINRDADDKTIKKQYHKLMAKYHPDSYKGKDNDQKAKLINEAYSVLSDAEEKKQYDEVWDSKQNMSNNTYENHQNQNNDYQQNDTSQDINYEDIKNSYTEQEILYAKRMALKKLIEEALEKIKLIVDAKNEIILNAYFGFVEKREYYDNVKDLMQIVTNFVDELKQLASKAYDLDLLEEEETLTHLITQIEQEINHIPTNVSDAYFYAQKEIFKENLKNKINEEISGATNILNELNILYINMSKGDIIELDFQHLMLEWKYKAEDCASKLHQLLKFELEFNMEEENRLHEIICKINSSILTMPKSYTEAVAIGKVILSINEIKQTISDWNVCNSKITKIMKILQRYPESYRYPFLYNYGIELLKKQLNEMEKMENDSKEIDLNLIREFNILSLAQQAKDLYKDANELHKKADDIYANKKTTEIFGEDIITIAEGSYSVWDKLNALETLVKVKELSEILQKLETPFVKELETIRKELSKNLEVAKKFNETFSTEYEWTKLNPNAYYTKAGDVDYNNDNELYNHLNKVRPFYRFGRNLSCVSILILIFLCITEKYFNNSDFKPVFDHLFFLSFLAFGTITSSLFLFLSMEIDGLSTDEEKDKVLKFLLLDKK